MHKKKRQFVIKLKRKRAEKIKKLREDYKKATTETEKRKILSKALKINPNLDPQDFLKNV